MMKNRFFFTLISLLCYIVPAILLGQTAQYVNEEGMPFIKNYSRNDYPGGTQNWTITQDSNGFIYVGNNDGVMVYDGARWKKIKTVNNSAVRSLNRGKDGVIYVGAQDELGYIKQDSSGRMAYESLNEFIDKADRNYRDIYQILIGHDGVYFRANRHLFRWNNGAMKTWKSRTEFYRAFEINGDIYLQEYKTGIVKLTNDTFQAFITDIHAREQRGYGFFKFGNSRYVFISRAGLFLYDGIHFLPIPGEATKFISINQSYNSILTPDSLIAVSTIRGGIIFLNQDGTIRRIIDKKAGMRDFNVKCLFYDRERNLWAGLQNGISKIELLSELTVYGENNNLPGTVQAVMRHQNTIYAATSQGLFKLQPQDISKKQYYSEFSQIPNTEIQCWTLETCKDDLLLGCNSGVFIVKNNQLKQLCTGYAMKLLYSRRFDCFFVGFINGLGIIKKENNRWIYMGRVKSLSDEVRSLALDEDGYLWIGTRYQHTARINFTQGLTLNPPIERFNKSHNIPDPFVFVYRIKNTIHFTTNQGILQYNASEKKFYPDTTLNFQRDSNFKAVYIIKEDEKTGNIWMTAHEPNSNGGIGCAILGADGIYRWNKKSFLRLPPAPVYYLYNDANDVAWFARTDGLIRYDAKKAYDNPIEFRTHIRQVNLNTDSVIFENAPAQSVKDYSIDYNYNSVRFYFSATSFYNEEYNTFSYWLEGYDRGWSAWSHETNKDYTNLPEGRYCFHVRSRNAYQTEGRPDVFAFIIKPPWFRTWWAYGIYAVFLGLGLWGFVRWRILRYRREKKELEKIIEARTAEISQKNDQLERIDWIAKTINSEVRLNDFLYSIFTETRIIKTIEKASALVYDYRAGAYRFIASRGWDMSQIGGIRLSATEAEERYVKNTEIMGEDLFLIRDALNRPHEEQFRHLEAVASMLVLRIRSEEQVMGYLIFDYMEFNDDNIRKDIRLLSQLKPHIVSGFIKTKLLNDLEKANEELKILNNTKNEFLGIAAHDLRNPLNAIIGFTDLMIMDYRDGKIQIKETGENLQLVHKSAKQMAHLISELLDISAIESGKITLEKRPHDLNQIFEECERMHKRAAAQKNIRMQVDKNADLPEVWVDKMRVMEVMDNLVSNAIKYTHAGGEVRVFAETGKGDVITHIQDTGQGLDEDDMKNIFMTYKKLSARPTGGESSTGLGLAIVKKIVEMHGGRVWVVSQKNIGSTFSFTIPQYKG